jgi:hypothetical protein
VSIFLFANNAATTLAAPISSTATSVTLASGTGSEFPSPSAGQQFELTFNDAATGLLTEIVYCTSRSGDVLTIVRAQEGTTAQSWLAGDLAANLVTAGQMAAMLQTASLFPARIVTASGAFTMSTSDAGGGVGLNRTSSLAQSSTTLPGSSVAGDIYAVEDLASNFNGYPVTVNAPAGMTIAGAANVLLDVNKQCAYFRYYGSNVWSFKQ